MAQYKGELELATTKNEELIKHKSNTTTKVSTLTLRGKVSGMPMELKIRTTPDKVQGVKVALGISAGNDKVILTIQDNGQRQMSDYVDEQGVPDGPFEEEEPSY